MNITTIIRAAFGKGRGRVSGVLFGSIFTGVLAAPPCGGQNAPSEQPPVSTVGAKIQFEDDGVHDCGRIAAGQPVNFAFKFTNQGDRALELSEVRPGCGCTVAGEWTRRVEPGQSGTIPITFTMSGEGAFMKTVAVSCNDPSMPGVSLQIKGNLWTPFALSPAAVVFNLVEGEAGTDVSRKVRIVNRSEDEVIVSDPMCANDAFRTTLTTIKPGKEFELLIEQVPGKAPKFSSSTVTLKTTLKEAPVLSCSIITSMLPAISVSPEIIQLPANPSGGGIPFHVMVRDNAREPIRISGLEITAPEATVKMTELEEGRVFRIAGGFPAGYMPDPAKGVKLLFKTDHPNFPRIEIPVTAPSASSSAPPPVPAPRISFAGSVVKAFGDVSDTEVLRHEFEFTNEDDKPVEITSVQACSSSGESGRWTRRVEPGKSGTIPVALNPAGLGGPVDIAFLVMANGSSTPFAELHLTASIRKAVEKKTLSDP